VGPSAITPADLACAFVVVNFLAFVLFGIDKAKAEEGRRRVAEDRLLMVALLGGSPGAYAGRALFRHKTRKQPFSARLHAIAALQLVALGAGLGWWLAG
jgi:uncharacterized membrane protein YsdA (DUF1294 family)